MPPAMKVARVVPSYALLVASLVGCSTVVGADFDGLRLAPASASGAGMGGSAESGGRGGTEAAGGAESGGAGEGGSAGTGDAGGSGSGEGGSDGGTSGNGGEAGTGGSSGTGGKGGSGGAGKAGSGGGITPPPPRVCGDMTGLDPDAPWPMDGACPTRIGRAAGSFAKLGVPTVAVYKASTDSDDISSVPVVDGAGNVYVMARRLTPNASVLRIFDDKSAPLGEFLMPNEVPGFTVLTKFGEEPSVLVNTSFQVRLLDRAGTKVLGGVASTGAFISGSPVVSGGTVFFVNALGQLHAWRPEAVESGDDHVSYDDGNSDPALQSPAIGPDGTIYFTKMIVSQTGGFLHAVTLTQNPLKLTKKWAVPFESFVYGGFGSRLAVAEDGTIVFSTTKALLGFDPDGKQVFSTPTDVAASLPTIVGDRVFHAGAGGTLFCITTKGKKLFESPAGFGSSLVATADGLVSYATLSPSRLIRSIDYATGTIFQERDTASFDTSPVTMALDPAGHPIFAGGKSITAYGSFGGD